MERMRQPPEPPAPGSRDRLRPIGIPAGPLIAFFAVVAAILLLPIWVWYWWRIEPENGEIAILIRKTGKDLPSGQVLATEPGQKGIQLDVLAEGRFFRNPYTWGWMTAKITDIPAGQLGVRTRLYGEDLPPGTILATETSKGILREVLTPGKYRINPYAYSVKTANAIQIRPGHVGVVTSLSGKDVMNAALPDELRNSFLVTEDLKGVLPQVLDPGTHYLNPYVYKVVEVNQQSQRFLMSGEDAITFLTADAFTITVEGTIEYALKRDKVALLTHQVGDMDDILKKIILPRARGFSRIEGSKSPAKNFITGQTRQQFQDNLEAHLQGLCGPWGISINSVLIRNIAPPDEISSVIRDREVALQTAKMYEQQIEQAKSKAELTKQEMLALQNKEKVDADTGRIRAVIVAEQDQAVRMITASQQLAVARIETDAAQAQAQAIMLTAGAEQSIIRMRNEAEAGVLASNVQAYETGLNFARHSFYEKIAPRIMSILTDDRQGLGGLLLPYVPETGKEVAK